MNQAENDKPLSAVHSVSDETHGVRQTPPESACERCGGRNVVWFAPNELWNRVAPSAGVICPCCFVELAEASGITPTAWRLTPETHEACPHCAVGMGMSSQPGYHWNGDIAPPKCERHGACECAVRKCAQDLVDDAKESGIDQWLLVRRLCAALASPCVGSGLRDNVQRLWDLVRFKRHDLLNDEIISKDEFSALVQDHPAVERLETNDKLRAELTAANRHAENLAKALEAVMVMWDRGECPKKLDAALTWCENDEFARKLAAEALASYRASKPDAEESQPSPARGPDGTRASNKVERTSQS